MRFPAQLELNLTIKDINAIYSSNYEDMLLWHARAMCEHQCRDGKYVQSIDRLVKRSQATLVKRDLSAKVRVYVVVEATAIRYDQYDFVTGMTVSKIIPSGKIGPFDMLECTNDHAIALLKLQEGDMHARNIKVGDKIPIRVGQAMYKIGNSRILINGFPCLPFVPTQVLCSMGKPSESAKQYFSTTMLPLIERELARKSSLDQDQWEWFSTLLHPFKTTADPKDIAATSSVRITDVGSIGNGLFGVSSRVSMSTLTLFELQPNAGESVDVITEAPERAIARLCLHFIKWLETVNNLVEDYPTKDAADKLEFMWARYQEQKQQN